MLRNGIIVPMGVHIFKVFAKFKYLPIKKKKPIYSPDRSCQFPLLAVDEASSARVTTPNTPLFESLSFGQARVESHFCLYFPNRNIPLHFLTVHRCQRAATVTSGSFSCSYFHSPFEQPHPPRSSPAGLGRGMWDEV